MIFTTLGALIGVGIYTYFFENEHSIIKTVYLSGETAQPSFSYIDKDVSSNSSLPNFANASQISRPAVVSVRSEKGDRENLFQLFQPSDPDEHKGRASGSGVLISEDGYVITNNHVIENADKVTVTMIDNREFEAKIVGADINTDLALLKIDANELPYLEFGNSDNTAIGDWVLAVGNPLNLTSTVTAGIISAKGRNLQLLKRDSDFAIESFIQTDAVVNRGNSGGALVNLNGELIGINTAISSHSGFYAGYSFAIPSSIARKVMEDLLMYGEVKRGLLGVSITAVNAEVAENFDLSVLKGAYVNRVNRRSGAEEAGIQQGDVLIAVNDLPVGNTSELQEQVSKYRPGDKIKITAYRGKESIEFSVELKSLNETLEGSRIQEETEEEREWEGK